MEKIESGKLMQLRVERAKSLIGLLRDEIDELKRRLNLVEVHNEELQQLFDKLSADQEALEKAIETSLENVDQEVIEGSFNAEENDEIAEAEDFGIDASADDDDFSFYDDEE